MHPASGTLIYMSEHSFNTTATWETYVGFRYVGLVVFVGDPLLVAKKSPRETRGQR